MVVLKGVTVWKSGSFDIERRKYKYEYEYEYAYDRLLCYNDITTLLSIIISIINIFIANQVSYN